MNNWHEMRKKRKMLSQDIPLDFNASLFLFFVLFFVLFLHPNKSWLPRHLKHGFDPLPLLVWEIRDRNWMSLWESHGKWFSFSGNKHQHPWPVVSFPGLFSGEDRYVSLEVSPSSLTFYYSVHVINGDPRQVVMFVVKTGISVLNMTSRKVSSTHR